ncbi:MAG: lipoprotein [Pseudomonadota bacterium]
MKHFKPYLLAFFLAAAFSVAACGQTGDLYLPEDEPDENVKNRSKK